MSVRMITSWGYGTPYKDLDKVFDALDVEFCACFFDDNENPVETEIIKPLNYDNKISFYRNVSGKYPLDASIIKKLEPYQQRCMDIIWRWRRSYTTDVSYKKIKEIYYVLIAYWYDYIKQNEINLLLLSNIPHVFVTYACYALCKALDIPIIILNAFCFVDGEKINRYLQSDLNKFDKGFDSRYDAAYEELDKNGCIVLSKRMERYFDMFNADNGKVKRVVTTAEDRHNRYIMKLAMKRLNLYLHRKDYAILAKKAGYYASLNFKEKQLRHYIEKLEESPAEEKFLFFPLHIQPEATTLPLGEYFVDQMLVIKMISACLPKGYFLYVKEHPAYWVRKENFESMTETRDRNFYREIKKLSNVRLIEHSVNSLDLMDDCVGVVNITGTAGFEAIFKHKPCLVFGNAYYKDFRFVKYIQSLDDCQRAVEDLINGRIQYTDNDIRAYLKAAEKYMMDLGGADPGVTNAGFPAISEQDISNLQDTIISFYRDNY